MDAAQSMLEAGEIPEAEIGKVARFLEGQGYKEEALQVATDKEHRFDLALALGRLDICLELARESDVEHRWKTVGDAALSAWDIKLTEECFLNARDVGSLLLLYSSSGDVDGLRDLAGKAKQTGMHNVAFSCLWQAGDVDGCLDLLLETGRVAEAVLFAQTYRPSRCRKIVEVWRSGLEKGGKSKVARMLGVPPATATPGEDGEADAGDAEMFPEWDEYLRLEKEGGRSGDLIDINGAGDDLAAAKAQAAPVDAANGDEDGDGDVSEQTETEI